MNPARPSSPRVVVFDVGNVLYRWEPRAIYAGEDSALVDRFLREAATFEWHEQHDRGRPFAETSAELAAAHPHFRELIARWGPEFNTSLSPLPGMAEIVAALDAAGVPLFAITNFAAEFWAPFRCREPLFDRFRDILVSGEERLIKPDPAIYALALRRFGLGDGEALFIDDLAVNVAAAERAGFVGHRFEDAAGVMTVLREHGLLWSSPRRRPEPL